MLLIKRCLFCDGSTWKLAGGFVCADCGKPFNASYPPTESKQETTIAIEQPQPQTKPQPQQPQPE